MVSIPELVVPDRHNSLPIYIYMGIKCDLYRFLIRFLSVGFRVLDTCGHLYFNVVVRICQRWQALEQVEI